jgi:hypothetical protein
MFSLHFLSCQVYRLQFVMLLTVNTLNVGALQGDTLITYKNTTEPNRRPLDEDEPNWRPPGSRGWHGRSEGHHESVGHIDEAVNYV